MHSVPDLHPGGVAHRSREATANAGSNQMLCAGATRTAGRHRERRRHGRRLDHFGRRQLQPEPDDAECDLYSVPR